MLYEELLDSCRNELKDFLKNVDTFENQFEFDDFSKQCYEHMYQNTNEIKTVKELKSAIPELKDKCKNCAAFFIPKRNQSIPKYDVLLGEKYERALMDFLKNKLSADIDRADLEDRSMPDYKIMKKDGSVVAYFEIKFHGAPFVLAYQKTGRYCYEGSATLDLKKIEKQLKLIDGLDVPVYYVHWIEYPCLKGIFYETSSQVKEYISEQKAEFKRKKREGDDMKNAKSIYLSKIYSPLLEMRSFENLLDELITLLE